MTWQKASRTTSKLILSWFSANFCFQDRKKRFDRTIQAPVPLYSHIYVKKAQYMHHAHMILSTAFLGLFISAHYRGDDVETKVARKTFTLALSTFAKSALSQETMKLWENANVSQNETTVSLENAKVSLKMAKDLSENSKVSQ